MWWISQSDAAFPSVYQWNSTIWRYDVNWIGFISFIRALVTCGRLVSDNSASFNSKLWNKRWRLKADLDRNLERVRDTQAWADFTKNREKPHPTSRDSCALLHEMRLYSVDPPLPWKLKGSYFVSSENKQTRQNTPRLTVYNGDNTSCFSIFGWRLWTLKSWRKIAENWRNCNGEKWRTEIRITRRKKKQWQENRNRETDVWK